MQKNGIKIEMALIEDAKSVDTNFNKYTGLAENSANQAISVIDSAIKNLLLAMTEAEKAEKIYNEIEKSALALGIKTSDIPFSITVEKVMMDSGQWDILLGALQTAKKSLSSTSFF